MSDPNEPFRAEFKRCKDAFLAFLEEDSTGGDCGIGINPDLHDLISELIEVPEAAASVTLMPMTGFVPDRDYHELLNAVIEAARLLVGKEEESG